MAFAGKDQLKSLERQVEQLLIKQQEAECERCGKRVAVVGPDASAEEESQPCPLCKRTPLVIVRSAVPRDPDEDEPEPTPEELERARERQERREAGQMRGGGEPPDLEPKGPPPPDLSTTGSGRAIGGPWEKAEHVTTNAAGGGFRWAVRRVEYVNSPPEEPSRNWDPYEALESD